MFLRANSNQNVVRITKKEKTNVVNVALDLIWAKKKNKKCSVAVYTFS